MPAAYYKLARSEANRLLDWVRKEYGFTSDCEMSHAIGMSAPDVSRIRTGKFLLGPLALLKLHDYTEKPLKDLRKIALDPEDK